MPLRLRFPLVIAFISLILLNTACSKLDTTTIGTDMLPAVDNVHTFADTMAIITSQGYFNNDSAFIGKGGDHVLGYVNDPLFGTTKGSVFASIKPEFFPYYLGKLPGDTLLALDSVVLCLKVKSFWGDSSQKIHFNVYQVQDNQFRDSIRKRFDVSYHPNVGATILASQDIDPMHINDTVHYGNRRDSSVGLIRIKLDYSWASQLFARDSVSSHPLNNAFYSDSIFRNFYNGLAIVPDGSSGRGLFYVTLADTSTKLEIHYKKTNGGIKDTTYSSFKIVANKDNIVPLPSSTANFYERSKFGAVMSPTSNELYIQGGINGTFANLSIPALATMPNAVVHRAELIVQRIPTDPYFDKVLPAPSYLYVDFKDTGSANNYKPVYFDLNPNLTYNPDSKLGYDFLPGSVDHYTYGGYPRDGVNKFGAPIKYFNINITRYVQQLITKHSPNYQLRLYAPYELYYPQYATPDYPAYFMSYDNTLGAGRVKVGSGTNSNYRMFLRVIYSKL